MNKNFTAEDILQKHRTNIKSAQSAFSLTGILGLIYIVRYLVTGNFDFYFSLSFTELMLRLGAEGTVSKIVSIVSITAFLAVYIVFGAFAAKNSKYLPICLGVYVFDFLCLGVLLFAVRTAPVPADAYIDAIVHLFVIVFISAGIYSHKKVADKV